MAKKTTKTAKAKKGLSQTQKIEIGVGLTAAAVAAAGAYFLGVSPNAKKNRAKVKSWTLKAKAEVLEALENAEEMTEEEFGRLVETVSKTYSKLSTASKADIANFKKEMRAHWPKIMKEGKQLSKTVGKVVKKKKAPAKRKTTAKKAVKKTTKKKK